MSIIISARYVQRPRTTVVCDECGKRITAHIRIYGMANFGNRPETLRLCVCHLDHQRDAKIQAALDAAKGR